MQKHDLKVFVAILLLIPLISMIPTALSPQPSSLRCLKAELSFKVLDDYMCISRNRQEELKVFCYKYMNYGLKWIRLYHKYIETLQGKRFESCGFMCSQGP